MFSIILVIDVPMDSSEIKDKLIDECNYLLKCVDYVTLVFFYAEDLLLIRQVKEMGIHLEDKNYFNYNNYNCLYFSEL